MLITRRATLLIPVIVLAGLLALTEVIYRFQRAVALNQHHSELVTRASDARAVLERELYPAIYIAVGLSSYIINRRGQVDETELEGWLSTLFTESRYLRNIAIAPDNRISLVYPLEENRAVLGLYYPDIPNQWPVVQSLMASREPLLQGPIPLVQGGQGLIYRIPVYIENTYWGLVSTVIDADRLFEVLEAYSTATQLSMKLVPTSADEPVQPFWSSRVSAPSIQAEVPLEIQGVAWTLCVSAPLPSGWLDNRYRYAGWSLALGLAVVLYLLLHSNLSKRLVQARFTANEERLQAILDGTHIGTWEWNVQTGETRFNERWADIVGYSLAELAPISIDTWMRLAHPKDLAASGTQLEEHFRGERPFYDIRCRMKHKHGHWVWVHDRGRVMTWTDDGKPLMMFGTHADVTDEVEAQRDLQRQKDLLRIIIDNIPINVYLKDRTGKKVLANRAERLFMGLAPDDENIGLLDTDFLPEDLAAKSQQEDQRVFQTGQSILAQEYDSQGPDGVPQWQLVSKIPLANEEGDVDRLLGITVNITDRKHTEMELQASRDQFYSLVENIPGISYRCLLDDDWTMLYISRQVDLLSGYPVTDFIHNAVRSYASIIHPEDNANNWCEVSHAIGEHRSWEIKYRVFHKDGSVRWAYEKGSAVLDEEGNVAFLDGFVLDITDQVEAETAMQDSEARLRALFELSPVGIALNDYETGTFLDVNQALLASSGYDREEFLALTYRQVTPDAYGKDSDLAQESLKQTGRYGPLEKEFLHKSGQRYPVRLNGVLITDRQGRKLIWSIIEDITESKRIERLKREFVSSVSHELRTPLTSISGALGLVRGGVLGQLSADALDMVAMAHDSAQQLTVLINDLLDMDKLVAGKMRMQLRPLLLDTILAKAVRENQPYADAFAVTLHLATPDTHISVIADEYRMMQILNNLLSNAAKFARVGTPVELGVESMGGQARIWVRDQGPGIAEDFADQIFEPFSQADGSDSRRRGGTGLGLAICKQLIELMQGSIGYSSEVGVGSTFYVDLPLAPHSAVHKDETSQ